MTDAWIHKRKTALILALGMVTMAFGNAFAGPIVYSALQGGAWDLWTIDPDTRERASLTQTPDRDERSPAWSRDGSMVAYSGSDGAIWVIGADGNNAKKVATGDGHCDHPTWHPDNATLTYAVSKIEAGEVSELWQVRLDSPEQAKKLFSANRAEYYPAWSPKKELLAFAHFEKDADQVITNELVLWDKRNTSFHQLTRTKSDSIGPAWSPDGASVAFTSSLCGNYDVWVMGVHRGALVRVTDSPAYDGQPAWEPSGGRLVFVSSRSGSRQLWITDADGTHPRQLTNGPGSSENPDWSPGGQQ
jgi:TolB protein